MSKLLFYLVFFCFVVVNSCSAHATDATVEVPVEQVSILLKGGTIIKGVILEQQTDKMLVRTREGLEINIDQGSIVSITPLHGRFIGDEFVHYDPNYTRLLFGPTGRPLKKGEGYFADYYVFFPSISYGFTDRFSLMAGMSLFPGVGFGKQVKYFAPRYAVHQSKNSATSVGFLNLLVNGNNSAGIAFASHTRGKVDKSFTAAIGFGYLKEESESVDFSELPIIMLGGNIRINNYTAFITENWLPMGFDLGLKQYPFTVALRFFSDNMAVDLGAILIGELVEDGLPIPWLSFVYNFDK